MLYPSVSAVCKLYQSAPSAPSARPTAVGQIGDARSYRAAYNDRARELRTLDARADAARARI